MAEFDNRDDELKKRTDDEINNSDELQSETQDLLSQQPVEQPMPITIPDVQSRSSRNAFNPEEILDLYRSLKPAQEKERNDMGNIGILAGANQIAQGFARGHGGDIGAGESGIKALQDQAKMPVGHIKQQLDSAKESMSTAKQAFDYQETQKMADPTSDISKFYQEQAKAALKRLNPDAQMEFDGISANQMMKNPMIKALFSQQPHVNGFGQFIDAKTGHPLVSRSMMGQVEVVDTITGQKVDPNVAVVRPIGYNDPTTGNRGYLTANGMIIPGQQTPQQPMPLKDAITGEISKAQPPTMVNEETLNKLNPKIYEKSFLKTREDLMHDKDIEKARSLNANVTNILNKLNVLDPNNPKVDAGLKEALAAQAGSISVGGGRLAEGVIKEFQGSGGLINKIKRYASEKGPGYMSPEDIKFFRDFALKLQKAAAQDAVDKSQTYVDRVKAMPFGTSIDDANARKLLNLGSLMQNSTVDQYKKMQAQKASKSALPGTSSAPDSKLGPNEVARRDPKSGRNVIYDATTKQPLRWADQ